MDCCGRELTTLVMAQYPVKWAEVLRVMGGDRDEGLRVERVEPPRLEPMAYALRWVECPRCGCHLDEEIVEKMRFGR